MEIEQVKYRRGRKASRLISEEGKKEALSLYDDGYSYLVISARFGVSQTTVRQWRQKRDRERRRLERIRLESEKQQALAREKYEISQN